jgi:hypothetical protein
MELIFVDSRDCSRINLQPTDASLNLYVRQDGVVARGTGNLFFCEKFISFGKIESATRYIVETISSQAYNFVSLPQFKNYYPERLLIPCEQRYGVDEVLAYAILHPASRELVAFESSYTMQMLLRQCSAYYANPATFVQMSPCCELNMIFNILIQLQHRLGMLYSGSHKQSNRCQQYFELGNIEICRLLSSSRLIPTTRDFDYIRKAVYDTPWTFVEGCNNAAVKTITTGYSNFEIIADSIFSDFPELERLIIYKKFRTGRRIARVCFNSEFTLQGKAIKQKSYAIDVEKINKAEETGGWRKMQSGGIIKCPTAGTKLTEQKLWDLLKL